MDTVSKEEFIDWKSNHVTKAVFEVIAGRIEDAKDILAASAGEDSLNDRFVTGMIRAFRELENIDWED